MATFNQVTFIGRLGKDPEMSYTQTGKPVTRFSLAVDQGKDQKSLWLNVSCWETLAERMNSFLYKGALVFVQGRLQVRSYTDKNNVERQAIDVTATAVQLLEKARTTTATPVSDPPEDLEDHPF
jgi:single-strand DNA-binding protein